MEDFNEIIYRLNKISNKWFPSHRRSDTGIGKTLEDLLGIKENNFPWSDGEDVEIKSIRKNSSSMISLFTKTPSPASSIKMLLDEYGYYSDENPGVKILHVDLYGNRYTTIKGVPSLMLKVTPNKINIMNLNKKVYGGWSYEALRSSFESKLGRVLLVKADSRFKDGREEFNYNEVWVLEGFSFNRFIKMIKKGIIKVEIRIGSYPNGSPHDHGTGFRILERNLQNCFLYRKRII